jgi:hypothetical protein
MTNKIVTYTHDPAAYATYSAFKSDKELNTSFEMWLADYKPLFGRKELQALKTLVRYSVKVAGIATLKYSTLVSQAKERYGFEFCSRTAKRAVEKARQLGMLQTLETRKKRKDGSYGNGPSIYIWQPYKCQNVTLENEADRLDVAESKPYQINAEQQQAETAAQSDSAAEMSPQKALEIKASIIKLLNTYKGASSEYTSIAKKLKIKKTNRIKLFTEPVKKPQEIVPLHFYSRLKAVVYSSVMNNESDLKAISEMVYGKVHSFTKFDVWTDHRETMLEHSLRVVEVCLKARKQGKLNKIKSMLGFINHSLDEEITAYILNEQKKILPQINPEISSQIIEMYS